MNLIRKERPEIFVYDGFGFCGYGSYLLHQELLKRHIDHTLLAGEYFRDTQEAAKCGKAQEAIIQSIPDKGPMDAYYVIKKQYEKRGHKLLKQIGHVVVVIEDTVFDITSGQFGLPETYPLDDFSKIWQEIFEVSITPNNKPDDFFIEEVKKIKVEKQPLYQEPGGTFESNGEFYDINYLFKATQHEPVQYIDISELVWVLKYSDISDEERIQKADVSIPILVTKYRGKELVVDGLHRLVKATRSRMKTLPYKRVSKEIFEASRIKSSVATEHAAPIYTHW